MFEKKNLLLFIPLIIILLIILIFPPHKLVNIKNAGFVFFKGPLSVTYRLYISIQQAKRIFVLYREYTQTKKELEKLKFKVNEFEEQRLENDRLKKILILKRKTDYNFIVAQVIGKEPTNWLNVLIIDKGAKGGIAINQPVMTLSGLVGKVIEIAPSAAKVLLISDVNSRVVALVQRTRQEGMLEGIGKGLCRLKYLPVDADIKLGDIVISAGVGGVYPKGLVLGKIESVRIERGGIYKSCIVKPSCSLTGLEEVLCLKSNSGF